MANRQIKEKQRKDRLKGRFKQHSGSETTVGVGTRDTGTQLVRYTSSVHKFGSQVVNTGPIAPHVFTGMKARHDHSPFETYWNSLKPDPNENTPREDVMLRLWEMLKDHDYKLKFSITNTKTLRLDLFFTMGKSTVFFVETDYVLKRVRRSVKYINKTVAMNTNKNNEVLWLPMYTVQIE